MNTRAICLIFCMVITLFSCLPSNSRLMEVEDTQTATVPTTKIMSVKSPELFTPITTPSVISTPTETLMLIPTHTPYPTRTQTQIPSPTLTPPPTLEQEQIEGILTFWMQESPAPCFWGIIPGRTTIGEAKNIFTRLGIPLESTSVWSKYYSTRYQFMSGLSISINLIIRESIVQNIDVYIHPGKSSTLASHELLAYSPDVLISLLGLPTKVITFISRGPNPGYQIEMYFESYDFVIAYSSNEVTLNDKKTKYRICPINDHIESAHVFLGKEPENLPIGGIHLEEAALLTTSEFAEIMMKTPKEACLEINREIFP